jgi:hypothetical protein
VADGTWWIDADAESTRSCRRRHPCEGRNRARLPVSPRHPDADMCPCMASGLEHERRCRGHQAPTVAARRGVARHRLSCRFNGGDRPCPASPPREAQLRRQDKSASGAPPYGVGIVDQFWLTPTRAGQPSCRVSQAFQSQTVWQPTSLLCRHPYSPVAVGLSSPSFSGRVTNPTTLGSQSHLVGLVIGTEPLILNRWPVEDWGLSSAPNGQTS